MKTSYVLVGLIANSNHYEADYREVVAASLDEKLVEKHMEYRRSLVPNGDLYYTYEIEEVPFLEVDNAGFVRPL